MTGAREQTIKDAIECYFIFGKNKFTILQLTKATGFDKDDLKYFRMFGLVDYKSTNNLRSYWFKKNPLKIKL